MKTITTNGYSVYSFDDETQISIGFDGTLLPDGSIDITTKSPASVLWEGVTLPADWNAYKYSYDGISWLRNAEWVDPNQPPSKEVQSAARAESYRNEADPIFFMSQRGEATLEEWQAKVAEIKARFPYPSE